MKKKVTLLGLFVAMCFFSCSESEEDQSEYANWKEKNEEYFHAIYEKATTEQSVADGQWKTFLKWSLDSSSLPEDHIVVKVMNESGRTESPLYTDSVCLQVKGSLMPTAYHSNGYVFLNTYFGEKEEQEVGTPLYMQVKGDVRGWIPLTSVSERTDAYPLVVDGLATALQHMHVGDRWLVYIPYQLGFGLRNVPEWGVPAYSTLVFDVTLLRIIKPAAPHRLVKKSI